VINIFLGFIFFIINKLTFIWVLFFTMQLKIPSPLENLNFPIGDLSIELYIKRDDLIHRDISGNKWRKLKYNIEEAMKSGKDTLLTFGGAFSNHIRATATAANMFGLKSIGIIRGEELNEQSNENFQFCVQQGMKLYFLDRTTYFDRNQSGFLDTIKDRFNLSIDNLFIVPEGGANERGALGCGEILKEIDIEFDYIVTACGTGTTFAGLINALPDKRKAMGISVLKDTFTIRQNIETITSKPYNLVEDYHFGGYAKKNAELTDFINHFQEITQIPLDYVYTGKMMFGLIDLIEKGYFKPKSRIIALHTGGVANAIV
jgi:1-aminocyclopropane-1-carboxylate deaminase